MYTMNKWGYPGDKMKKIYSALLICIMSVFISSCGGIKTGETITKSVIAKQGKTVDNIDISFKREITVIAAGDVMFHMPQVKSAYTGSGYNFDAPFLDIKKVISSSDIAAANLETTINPLKKLSGYPHFNSPPEVLDGLKYAGFDVLTTANNHCMDTGAAGILNTVKEIKKRGMIPVGTGTADTDKFVIIEKNGIKVGMLSYTYGTNYTLAPVGMVNYVNINKIKNDINTVKKKSDFIIVFIHYGNEYVRKPEEAEISLFRKIADSGADCVIGGHPHVARSYELYDTNGKKVLIAYSLGNLLSSQKDKYTDIGLIVKLNITKENDKIKLENYEMLPVYNYKYYENKKYMNKLILTGEIDSYKAIPASTKEYIKNTVKELTGKADT